jgi:hypothetical protein
MWEIARQKNNTISIMHGNTKSKVRVMTTAASATASAAAAVGVVVVEKQKILTLAELCELDAKTCDRAMQMLADHKDFDRMILQTFLKHRVDLAILEQKKRDDAAILKEQKRVAAAAQQKIYDEEEQVRKAQEMDEEKRVSTLTFDEKKKERYKIEKRRYSGWTLMGGGIDANEYWDDEHERLNQLYGADTFIPKRPRPLYPTASNPASENEDSVSDHEKADASDKED